MGSSGFEWVPGCGVFGGGLGGKGGSKIIVLAVIVLESRSPVGGSGWLHALRSIFRTGFPAIAEFCDKGKSYLNFHSWTSRCGSIFLL